MKLSRIQLGQDDTFNGKCWVSGPEISLFPHDGEEKAATAPSGTESCMTLPLAESEPVGWNWQRCRESL